MTSLVVIVIDDAHYTAARVVEETSHYKIVVFLSDDSANDYRVTFNLATNGRFVNKEGHKLVAMDRRGRRIFENGQYMWEACETSVGTFVSLRPNLSDIHGMADLRGEWVRSLLEDPTETTVMMWYILVDSTEGRIEAAIELFKSLGLETDAVTVVDNYNTKFGSEFAYGVGMRRYVLDTIKCISDGVQATGSRETLCEDRGLAWSKWEIRDHYRKLVYSIHGKVSCMLGTEFLALEEEDEGIVEAMNAVCDLSELNGVLETDMDWADVAHILMNDSLDVYRFICEFEERQRMWRASSISTPLIDSLFLRSPEQSPDTRARLPGDEGYLTKVLSRVYMVMWEGEEDLARARCTAQDSMSSAHRELRSASDNCERCIVDVEKQTVACGRASDLYQSAKDALDQATKETEAIKEALDQAAKDREAAKETLDNADKEREAAHVQYELACARVETRKQTLAEIQAKENTARRERENAKVKEDNARSNSENAAAREMKTKQWLQTSTGLLETAKAGYYSLKRKHEDAIRMFNAMIEDANQLSRISHEVANTGTLKKTFCHV